MAVTLVVLGQGAVAQAQDPVTSDTRPRVAEVVVVEGAPEAADMSGAWVYLEQITTVSDLTVIGETYSTTRAVALYELVERGGTLSGEGTMCSLNMKTDSRLINTTLPPAFTRSVEAPPLALVLTVRGGETVATQPRQYRVFGAHLDQPATESLPTAWSDRRVIDQDRDGNPGVTVVVQGLVDGEIHLVQRQWNELTGKVLGQDRIEGGVRFGREERVLGTTNSVLSDPPEAKAVYRRSFFRLVRVREGTTCAGLKRAFETL